MVEDPKTEISAIGNLTEQSVIGSTTFRVVVNLVYSIQYFVLLTD